MDINACLAAFIQAALDGDTVAMSQIYNDLIGWFYNGGFAPDPALVLGILETSSELNS